jgi:lysophospholipase L1-like esterase
MAAVRLVPNKLPLFALLLTVGLSAGCESPAGTTPPPPVTGPTLLCPSDITVSSTTGEPLPVHFPLPSGETTHPPVTVKCSPEPDSEFPVGSNPVVCTAVDTVGQTSCSFRVAVSMPERRLKVSKFMAFGDSITEGFLRDPPEYTPAIKPLFLDPVENYPHKLEQMLRTRYGSSDIVVINEGLGGETIEGGTERIVEAMAEHQPEVVLLLEGYNGLRDTTVSQKRSGLRSMARWAETHGAQVVLATLFQISDERESTRPGSQATIDDLNDAIRGLGSSLGHGGVADLERAFGTGVGLLGTDGLHPNPAGYQLVAETFLDEIVRRFEEIPQTDPAPIPAPNPSRAALTPGAPRSPSAARHFTQRSGH